MPNFAPDTLAALTQKFDTLLDLSRMDAGVVTPRRQTVAPRAAAGAPNRRTDPACASPWPAPGAAPEVCRPAFHILVVEDQPLYRDAVSQALHQLDMGDSGTLRCSTAAGQDEALDLLAWNPDIALVLADHGLTQGNGLALLQAAGPRWPTMARVLMSGSANPGLCEQARRLGLAGCIPKSLEPRSFVQAVQCVLGGDTWFPAHDPQADAARHLLTERQASVLACVAAGQGNKAVARALGISERTIQYHLEGAFEHLNATSRAEAVATALAKGLIKLPP